MIRFAFALAATALIASPPAMAAPCKDAKGKFIKCPPKVATKSTTTTAKKAPCRDAKGRFKKC